MKKLSLFISFVLINNLVVCQNYNAMDQTIYQFKVKDIKGNIFDFENWTQNGRKPIWIGKMQYYVIKMIYAACK